MYVGRIVAVARTPDGRAVAMYRNRRAVTTDTAVAIVPKPGHETDVARNPYIAYNCLRVVRGCAVAANGSHTDPIAEKIAAGMPVRDALVFGLAVLDYEHDSYSTPRIAATIAAGSDTGWLGIVRHDALLVKAFTLRPGEAVHVATYKHTALDPGYRDPAFDAPDAAGACEYIISKGAFAKLERPITAAAAVQRTDGDEFEIAVKDAPALSET